jgi:hypothetical protein
MIDEMEWALNYVSDLDHEWGPFLFLRPERHAPMTSSRVAALALLYGVLVGCAVNVVVRLTGEHAASLSPLFFPAATTVAFFAFYRLTFARCWNRRAARLRGGARE